MNIYKVIEDKNVYHWVIAIDSVRAIDIVKHQNDYNFSSETTLDCEKLSLDKNLTIDCGEFKIKHTVEEWLEIYEHEPRYLACSEY